MMVQWAILLNKGEWRFTQGHDDKVGDKTVSMKEAHSTQANVPKIITG